MFLVECKKIFFFKRKFNINYKKKEKEKKKEKRRKEHLISKLFEIKNNKKNWKKFKIYFLMGCNSSKN
jgi:hypothetical protein